MQTLDARAHLIRPIYSYAEADRVANVSRGTSKRWLEGYKYRTFDGVVVRQPPVSTAGYSHAQGGASFVDLVEVVAISGLRQWFTPQNIRDIVRECEEIFGTRHPLASQTFQTDGQEIFVSPHTGMLVGLLGRRWETAWHEMLRPFLLQLDYQGEIASRWWPMGRDAQVVVDPEYGFGLPVVHGTGIRTEIIAERFEHELAEEIADDLRIDVTQVARALQFEVSRRKAA